MTDEDEDEEILREFLVESSEILDQLDREFVELEADPSSHQRLASIFRAAHTIKGTSGLLGYHKLEAVTHAGENILVRLRDGKLTLSPPITSSLLKMVDAIRDILQAIESTGSEGDAEYSSLVQELQLHLNGGATPGAGAAAPSPAKPEAPGATDVQVAAAQAAPAPDVAPQPSGEAPASALTASIAAGAAVESDAGAAEVPQVTTSPQGDSEPLPAPVAESVPKVDAVSENVPAKPELPSGSVKPQSGASDDAPGPVSREGSVRVGVSLLDKLMNLVGELVLARNQVLQCSTVAEDPALSGASQRLNLITTELQEGVMKTRMQPIGNVWSKFPRIVRDLAVSCDKRVQLEMEGKETELDRTIIEAIRDPLTHIVRNSVDHGIELPADRVARGKPASGTLNFRAFHEGGMVNIEVTDDGKGIDPDAVRAKAVERGLLTAEAAARLGDRETTNLIFQAGFSTAKQVTNVSGRGVGMDVVKSKIEKIAGTVDVQSVKGEGTSIRVKIPLTLAIIPALVVTCQDQRYAMPQVSLVELVRVHPEEGQGGSIEFIRDAPVYRLRGELLPLVFLEEVLGREKRSRANLATTELNIVVLQAESRLFGLVVDTVEDTQEIVVKPLGRELKGISAFAGATIMGDGRVALILDVFGIAGAAGIGAGAGESRGIGLDSGERDGRACASLLIFESLSGQRLGVALASVDRLEEVACERIETAGRRPVLQYRGRILPLVFVEELCGEGRASLPSEPIQVIVVAIDGRCFGLVVKTIADIVDHHESLHQGVTRPGVCGCVVVQGRVIELLDLSRAGQFVAAEVRAAA